MAEFKTVNSDALLKEQLKNKEFREEYDALEEEFEIAKEIIRLRTNAKITQKQLAEMAGTSQPAIARLESGDYKNVTLSFLRRIGKALGVIPQIHFINSHRVEKGRV
jgi:DNA-binding Xre family transcriptional regulator